MTALPGRAKTKGSIFLSLIGVFIEIKAFEIDSSIYKVSSSACD
jgi:hypothetical protein